MDEKTYVGSPVIAMKLLRNDQAGYDIRYRVDKNGNWIYVEVKNAADDAFIISSPEITFGLDNKESYELALVKHSELFMVKGFFLEDGWQQDFTIESNYIAVPKDWVR